MTSQVAKVQGLKLNLFKHKPFISEHTVPMLAWLNKNEVDSLPATGGSISSQILPVFAPRRR